MKGFFFVWRVFVAVKYHALSKTRGVVNSTKHYSSGLLRRGGPRMPEWRERVHGRGRQYVTSPENELFANHELM